jgi:enoyl-CoA hydratase
MVCLSPAKGTGMTDAPVLTRIENRTGILTFNRPRVMNAFDSTLIAATHAAMAGFQGDDRVQAIVIHGEGRCFSAGFDMKESAAKGIRGEDEWRAVLTTDFDFIMQFWDSPKPTIAAAHGFCIAGAMEVLMACDLAVASQETLMGEPEVRFGSGIVAMLAPYVTGPKHAKELLLIGNDRIPAQRCLEMGLINRLVPEGEALSAALALADQITRASAPSVQKTKRAINRTFELARMREGLAEALEIDVQIEADESPERMEFNRIRREGGLKAALDWRNRRIAEIDPALIQDDTL